MALNSTHSSKSSAAPYRSGQARPPTECDAWAVLQSVLSAQRPIAYSVNVARFTGDIKSALFLSQLIYWTRVGVDIESHGGWIFKTREQWTAETNLTRYEQESARSRLLQLELIEEKRVGVPARNCYRVIPTSLGHALAKLLRAEPRQLTLFDIRENGEQVRSLIGRNLAFYPVFSEMTQSLTVAIYLSKALSIQKYVMQAQNQRLHQSKHTQLSWDQDWFNLSVKQLTDETGLTSAQQRDSKQKLCQLELFEEATVTYPKRMTFTRIRLNKLAQQLQLFLNKKLQANGKTPGLLGAIARGLNQDEPENFSTGVPKRRTDSAGISSPNWQTSGDDKTQPEKFSTGVQKVRTDSSGISTQNLRTQAVSVGSPKRHTESSGFSSPNWQTLGDDKTQPEKFSTGTQKVRIESGGFSTQNLRTQAVSMGSPKRHTESAGFSSPNWQTLGDDKTQPEKFSTGTQKVRTESSGFSTQNLRTLQKPPSSFSLSSKQVGGFSQASRGLFTSQKDGFNATSRLDLAALHVRGEFRITNNLNTTTTTTALKHKSSHLQNDQGERDAVVVVLQNLIWPTELPELAKTQCSRLLSGLSESVQQDLIDELAGHLMVTGRVKSPIAYLGKLVRLHRETPGGLVLEMAVEVQQRRKARAEHAQRMAAQVDSTTNRTAAPSPVDQQLSAAALDARQKLREMRQSWDKAPTTPVAKTSQQEQAKPATVASKKAVARDLSIGANRSLFFSRSTK